MSVFKGIYLMIFIVMLYTQTSSGIEDLLKEITEKGPDSITPTMSKTQTMAKTAQLTNLTKRKMRNPVTINNDIFPVTKSPKNIFEDNDDPFDGVLNKGTQDSTVRALDPEQIQNYKRKQKLRVLNQKLQRTFEPNLTDYDPPQVNTHASKMAMKKSLMSKIIKKRPNYEAEKFPTLDESVIPIVDDLITITEQILNSAMAYIMETGDINLLPQHEVKEIYEMASNLEEVLQILEYMSRYISTTMVSNEKINTSNKIFQKDTSAKNTAPINSKNVSAKTTNLVEKASPKTMANTVKDTIVSIEGYLDTNIMEENPDIAPEDALAMKSAVENLKDIVNILGDLNKSTKNSTNLKSDKSKQYTTTKNSNKLSSSDFILFEVMNPK